MTERKPKLLWVGDCVIASGFSACTHAAVDALHPEWDVTVIGINYDGGPHDKPYKVYPAARAFTGEDAFGVMRFAKFIPEIRPDAAVLLNDVWNVKEYMKYAQDVPVVGWLAVDGLNSRGSELNGLAGSVFWTEWASDQAMFGGYRGPSAVIPLGVDTELFQPKSRLEARGPRALGLMRKDGTPVGDEMFVVGVVGRNQERKRLDLSLMYFAEWIRSRRINDALMFIHAAPTGEQSVDIPQLVQHLGLSGHVLQTPAGNLGYGLAPDAMAYVYSCFDMLLSCSQAEGWNLCAMEAMACGVPVAMGDYAGPGEWAKDVAHLMPCSTMLTNGRGINAIHAVPDKQSVMRALDVFYKDWKARKSGEDRGVLASSYAAKGLSLVRQPQFQWSAVGRAFADVLKGWVWPGDIQPAGVESRSRESRTPVGA